MLERYERYVAPAAALVIQRGPLEHCASANELEQESRAATHLRLSSGVAEARMRVDIYLLGGFEVVVDGVPIPDEAWRRRDSAALVKLLALSSGHRMPREQVLDALWPDLLVEHSAPRLHKAAHFSRTALGHRDGVRLSRDAVSLFPAADVVVDVEQLRRGCGRRYPGSGQ